MAEKSSGLKLADYTPPNFQIPKIDLEFVIHSTSRTLVKSKMEVTASGSQTTIQPLELKGEKQKLKSVKIDGRQLAQEDYTLTDKTLIIPHVPPKFTLEIETEINPAGNTELSGFYQSGDHLVTQCEAEGFRRITYHPDRPDVMSRYTTRIEADKTQFPILLSNGNLVKKGDLPNEQHFTLWEDPFLKPSYLFALVASDLGEVRDSFDTKSGKKVDLIFYVDKGDKSKALHAVASLKKAMKWDEDTFSREYDLDQYMVVAVNSFNFGAMENKGLNIFNSKYVLADPETATDLNFENILGVIGHEYFHNWTGNRVTLRDWFQLTLKEGLTVYRDQLFTEEHTSKILKRLTDVFNLRTQQFPEDSGPTAHPIKPAEVGDIENFYTATVYNKGAAVIRMISTLIGKDNFRKGMDNYFQRFDGMAVTTEDFIDALEQGSGKDLTQFKRWYSQVGTPICDVKTKFDPQTAAYSITITQSNPQKNGTEQGPLHIPIQVGLVGPDGKDIYSQLLELTELEQTFVFTNISSPPVPSLLRNFTAPIKLNYEYTEDELAFLLAHDSDKFNRYEAGHRLAIMQLNSLIADLQSRSKIEVRNIVVNAFGSLLEGEIEDYGFIAEALNLPSVTDLVEEMEVCDYDSASEARRILKRNIALTHEVKIKKWYTLLNDGKLYTNDPESVGKRSLKNTLLSYLISTGRREYTELAFSQFNQANNMTDSQASLNVLMHEQSQYGDEALQNFYDRWKNNVLVMDKWLSLQAYSNRTDIITELTKLEQDPVYDAKNPNKIKSLIGTFMVNHERFHDSSGKGYEFVTDRIIAIDQFNPLVAATLAKGFEKYSRLDENRKQLLGAQLQRILDAKPSEKLSEIISKTLESA